MKIDALRRRQARRTTMLLAAVLLATGCSVTPWVRPYERERLDDPLMRLPGDRMSERHIERVRNMREGTRGATGVQGGGCGCN